VTTRTLVLLRHAKAESPAALADLDRHLTDRGHADATAAGRWLSVQGYAPQLVLCSPAQRTRDTWLDVAPALSPQPEVRYDQQLYASGVGDLYELIQSVDDGVTALLMVGHNPVLSQLSLDLDEGADPQGLHTAGIAVHRFDGDWAGCTPDVAPIVASHRARA
jgi:phosphohistidine phosphatase